MDFRVGLVAVVATAAALQAAPALAAAPANDNFATAQVLTGTSTSATGTTSEATLQAGEPNHFVSGNGSVWYSWTAAETSVLHLDTCAGAGPSPTRLQLYRGSSLASLQEVNERSDFPNRCDVGSSDSKVFNVTAGTTYAISVIEYVGDTAFTLSLSASPTPANDDFANAQDLGQALDVDVDGTTVGTTLEPGEPDYFGNVGDGDSVWYRWTAPKRTRVWIDNCGAASDSAVEVYTGNSVESLQPVGSHFGEPPIPSCEGGGLYGGRDEFLATAGTTYVIRVYTKLFEAGTFHLRMRDIRFDASLTQTASAKKIKKGKTVTYTIDIANLGTVAIDPAVDLVTSKPNQLAKPVVGTKYVSIDVTHGTCKTVKFFAVHPGAI